MTVRRGILFAAVLLAALAGCWLGWVWKTWRSIPLANTAQTKFDAILVLGAPCRRDGTPSPEQRERVLEGVRQWRAGVAPRMIVSGGAAHNRWVEAESMGRVAEQQGVPAADILEEGRAMNTIQNVYYSAAIMQAHGWGSVDVVSTWYHLPRAALILAHFPVLWRTQAAPWPPSYTLLDKEVRIWREAIYCMHLKQHGFTPSRFLSR